MELTFVGLTGDCQCGEARSAGVQRYSQVRVEMTKNWSLHIQDFEMLEGRLSGTRCENPEA
jgi:hypothetical protein